MFTHLVPLGHCISTLLHTLSHSSNELRRDALRTLCALAGLNTAPLLAAARLQEATPTQDQESSGLAVAVEDYLSLVRERVGRRGCGRGKALASFLPGISTAVTRMLTSDAKTVELVISLGLVTWAHYVTLVMDEGEGEVWPDTHKEEGGDKGGSLLVTKTTEWLEGTAKRLSVLIQRIFVLVTSDQWRVRLQLVGWAHALLQHCSR